MRRYLVYLASSAAFVGLLFASFALYYGSVQGDLTRIGGWSERDFAPVAAQPAIAQAPRAPSAGAADVLVLGDSFSQPNEWQSALFADARLSAHTTHFDAIGCLDNWVRWALAQPARQAIVVQTVEREFVKRFRDRVTCRPNRTTNFIPLPFLPASLPTNVMPLSFSQLDKPSAIKRAALSLPPTRATTTYSSSMILTAI